MRYLYWCIIGLSTCLYGINFDIQAIRVGPNPLIQSRDGLAINYVATMPHQSHYYLISPTGAIVWQHQYEANTPRVSAAGECQFNLIPNHVLQELPPQLYILMSQFITESKTIRHKQYVILK
jgi:hypothetical protein